MLARGVLSDDKRPDEALIKPNIGVTEEEVTCRFCPRKVPQEELVLV